MSGVVGHVVYALLAARLAERRGSAAAAIIARNRISYLAGAYLGCDIQTLPEAVCLDTGQEAGYGTVPLARSPYTGGPVRPYALQFGLASYSPYDIHALFYGRSHLVFGWQPGDQALAVPWSALPDYFGRVAADAGSLFGPGDRAIAYALGWMAHVVGDCLIKSVQPGIRLNLLDGTYTPRNRPIQDLYAYHDVGRREFGLDWPRLLDAMAGSPVERVQAHFMRAAEPRGALASGHPAGWQPELHSLLRRVLAENRRYLRHHAADVVRDMALTQSDGGWECSPQASEAAGGLTYRQMMDAAHHAGLRTALDTVAAAASSLFDAALAIAARLA